MCNIGREKQELWDSKDSVKKSKHSKNEECIDRVITRLYKTEEKIKSMNINLLSDGWHDLIKRKASKIEITNIREIMYNCRIQNALIFVFLLTSNVNLFRGFTAMIFYT